MTNYTLPLIRLIDDVTYLHVEPPVLRLQRAAGRSFCQRKRKQGKFQLHSKAVMGIDTFLRQYHFCTKSHRSILYSCCGEHVHKPLPVYNSSRRGASEKCKVFIYSSGSGFASLLGGIAVCFAAKCFTMFTRKQHILGQPKITYIK